MFHSLKLSSLSILPSMHSLSMFLEGAAAKHDRESIKVEFVVDPAGETEVIEL